MNNESQYLEQRLATLEERFSELGYTSKRLVESSIKRSFKVEAQTQTLNAPIVAFCISTIDPLNLSRIRIFHPLLCKADVKISGLPFARACSALGGIDDCGVNWVPPAGSSVVVVCENGDRQSPIYLGTTWHKDRGPSGNKFSYPIDEFYTLWRDEDYRGKGYLVGKTDGSQVYPPWSSESGNHNDFDNEKDIDKDPDAQLKITYPYIYGMKTPGKHMIKMVDGDHRCNDRWSRFEIMSKRGNWIMMKDDWIHEAGEWAGLGNTSTSDNSPECSKVSALLSLEVEGNVDPNTDDFTGVDGALGQFFNNSISCKNPPVTGQFKNPYFKRQEELRPYIGANTPLKNKCELKQSGLQIQCISGHQVVMDDSVNQPKPDKIKWYKNFDYGCDEIFKGKFYLRSSTGHYIGMDDSEDVKEIRGQNNGIKIQTACGNYVKLNDHTLENRIAAEDRGVEIGSTSGHTLTMSDAGNEQASEIRKDGGEVTRKAKQGFVQLKTGYGLIFRMDDSTSQEDTRNQFIMLAANPKETSACKQTHMLLMQLEESGGGFIELASGGRFLMTCKGNSMETVGTSECEGSKVSQIFGNYLIDVKNTIFTKCKTFVTKSDDFVILAAGHDCPISDDPSEAAQDSLNNTEQSLTASQQQPGKNIDNPGPCLFPIVIAKEPWTCPLTGKAHFSCYSDRVFAACSKDAKCP